MSRHRCAAPPDLVAAIRRSDEQHGLFERGSVVVVGVSGGPDSVALLHALNAYAREPRLKLIPAHLDHALRPGSAGDAALVASTAAKLGLGLVAERRDVPRLADKLGTGLEEAARLARYAFLAAVAARAGARSVAVGHNADDQAETVLMNFLRGAGLRGLKGMTPVSDYPVSPGRLLELEGALDSPAGGTWPPKLVRPLLEVTRERIAAYVRQEGLAALADPANRDPAFLRNRIRHEVLPALATHNPKLRAALCRNARALAGDLELIEALVDDAWQGCAQAAGEAVRFRLAPWRALHPALQRRLLLRAVHCLAPAAAFSLDHIEALRRSVETGTAAPSMPGNLRLEREKHEVVLTSVPAAEPRPRLPPETVAVEVPSETDLPGGWHLSVRARKRRADDQPSADDRWAVMLDADAAGRSLAVRGRRPGDRIRLLGMAGRHKSLQDLFVDEHVPRDERDGWPLLVANDAILWVPGLRMAELARVGDATDRVLIVKVQPPARLS